MQQATHRVNFREHRRTYRPLDFDKLAKVAPVHSVSLAIDLTQPLSCRARQFYR